MAKKAGEDNSDVEEDGPNSDLDTSTEVSEQNNTRDMLADVFDIDGL